jgi:O-antigen/teichoic acid export membrane protein
LGIGVSLSKILNKSKERLSILNYKNRFIPNIIYSGIGQAVQLIVGIFLVAYLVRKLGTERWGLVVLAMSTASILSLFQMGASTGIAKKLNQYLTICEEKEFTRYYTAGVVICLLLSLIMMICLIFFLTLGWQWMNISDNYYNEGRAVLAAIGVASILATNALAPIACLQAMHRIDIYAKFDMASVILRITLTVLMFELVSPQAYIYAFVLMICNLFVLVGTWWWVHINQPKARVRFSVFDTQVFNSMIRFNMMTMFNTLNYTLFMQGPAFLLQRYAGLSAAGLYGIGLQINTLLRSFFTIGANTLSPVVISLESSGNKDKMKVLFCMWTKFYSSVALMMWAGLVLLRRPILHIWVTQSGEDLLNSIPWIAGATIIGIMAMPSAIYMVALERLRLSAIAGLLLFGAMVGTMVFRLRFGESNKLLIDTCIILALYLGCYQMLRVWIISRIICLRCLEFWCGIVLRSIIPVLIILPALIAIIRIFPPSNLHGLLIVSGGTLLVFATISYVTLFGREERGMILDLYHSIRYSRQVTVEV